MGNLKLIELCYKKCNFQHLDIKVCNWPEVDDILLYSTLFHRNSINALLDGEILYLRPR